MKLLLKINLLLLALIVSNTMLSENPRVYFAYSTFLSPKDGPFIETYLQVDASSLNFVGTGNDEFQATLEVLLILKQDGQIRDFKKYELKSPPIKEPSENGFSFIDQQRFLLPRGEYELEISLADLNKDLKPISHSEYIAVDIDPTQLSLSSVQLAERIEQTEVPGPLTKSGYNIYPYIDFFYPSHINSISFYSEVYNASDALGEGEAFLIVSSIETFETRRVLSDFNRFKRETAKPVNVTLNSFDISKLPSGNYFLVVSVKDRQNETLASNRVFFQRSNPSLELKPEDFEHVELTNTFAEQIVDIDSLSYFIKALSPISDYSDRQFAFNLASSGNLRNMQRYFYNFWLQRDPSNPQEAWKHYYIELCRADANFKTMVHRGYETDRGRVYLQYGPPNSINSSYDEPASYPYEIWHYYVINGQRNKRFVFYTHDITTNNFELLHSEMIGELSNPRWMSRINSRNEGWGVDYEETVSPRNRVWGSKMEDYYREPR
jgi:GWxTD domain-containing protein